MRRIIILGTAVAVLAGASVAIAATGLNSYTAGFAFKPTKAGSKHKPVPVSFTETYNAASATAGNHAAPLINIKTWIYGVVSNGGKFPTCNGTEISVKKTDSFCPKKALVAQGHVNSLLGTPNLGPTGPTFSCNPGLDVWNGGKGKLWFFFTATGTQCGSLHTGDTDAYEGFIQQQGKYEVTNVPLPSFISTAVANHPNLFSSLVKQVLTFKNSTIKKGGKTYGMTASVGCLKGKRPFKVAFTATNGSTIKETKVVTGSSKC